MKNHVLKTCLMALGLYLFFTVIFPYPVAGNIMVAKASSVENEQNDDIKLNVKSKSLVKDTTYDLIIYNIKDDHKVIYKSSDNSIVTINDKGVITAVDFGVANVIVTVKDGSRTIATLQCEVTVGPPAISIKLTKSDVTLSVGNKTSLTAILKPNNTVETAKFFSEDTSIATVSIGGRITAKSPGVTYIRAYIDNGKYDTCIITVVDDGKNTDQSGSSDSE